MRIKKRDGSFEKLSFDRISYRLRKLAKDTSLGKLNKIDVDIIVQKVVERLYDSMPSSEIDEESARIAVSMIENEEYPKLASRIIINNLHKNTVECFSDVMESLNSNLDIHEERAPIVSDDFISWVRKYKNEINDYIDFKRDFNFDYFGFKTLEKSYLFKMNEKVVERPQHLYMRVALSLHQDDLENTFKTYDLISQGFYTHASPTMFNAGKKLNSLSSCFLTSTSSDSVEGIFKTITDCAKISKVGGGIGVHISNVRARGSIIRKTNGKSDGIIPMLKVYNDTANYINQCIHPDVIIYTNNGFKEIKKITTNDYVITNDGSFKKVNRIFINQKDESIYNINTNHRIDALKCTGNHEICVLNIDSLEKKSIIKRKTGEKENINFTQGEIENYVKNQNLNTIYKNAEDLTDQDWMCFPIPNYNPNDIIEWTTDFCRLYGILLGDGCIIKDRNRYGITFDRNKKVESYNFVINYLNELGIHYWETEADNYIELYWTGNFSKIPLLYDMIYDDSHSKRVDSRCLTLPKIKLYAIAKGLMETDGCTTDTGIFFVSTSKNLLYFMRYVMLCIGILTSCVTIDKVGQLMGINKKGVNIISKKINYSLRMIKSEKLKEFNIYSNFISTTKFKNQICHNGMIYTKIKNITRENYFGDVYDLNIEDNHNYLTDMGLVHNSGSRKGSFAIYLEPFHADIMEFLDLKKNQGHEDLRARDLFYAMWIPDLFMEKVEKNEPWYLMCPDQCPGLTDVYGEEFNALYNKYVEGKRYIREIPAQEIWTKILESQIETGTPYLLYKDAINRKSNQKNIGVIKSSNLCVAPDTMILTKTGYRIIKSLENKNVKVWNGNSFTDTIVRKTGENKKLLSLLFNNGVELKCTPEHIFYNKVGEKIRAKDLQTNDTLLKCKFPKINEGILNLVNPYKKTIDKKYLQNIRLLVQLSGKDTRIVETSDYMYELKDITNDFELKLIVKRELPELSDTYCFTECERGMGVFNGILTGQCAEITLVSNSEEIAVCNLSSISLPKYVEKNEEGKLFFNHEKLFEVAKYIITPMNKVIDLNYYPTEECKLSNMRHRPLGIGVQGLHDTFILLKMSFSSPEARELNKRIFETIYYGTLVGSNELAKKDGAYSTFKDSPASQGQLQFDLWDIEEENYLKKNGLDKKGEESLTYNWTELKESIAKYGLRNSMLTTCMPTASSAQILGNCESIEPFDSCIFKRRVLSGEYIIVNKHLLRDLTELKIWNKQMKDQIILNNGSIQNIPNIPDKIKELYKTVWEMSMKDIIVLSADRGRFIDHTQSLNLFIADPTISKLTSMHFFAWKKHLKTGLYYLRSKESSGGAKFSIDPEVEKTHNELAKLQCSIDNKEDCMMCSS